MTEPTEADLEKARKLVSLVGGSEDVHAYAANVHSVAQALADARHAEELISVHWQRRVDAAEARVKELEALVDTAETAIRGAGACAALVKALEEALRGVLPWAPRNSAEAKQAREELNRG